jgi:hypothetical protein
MGIAVVSTPTVPALELDVSSLLVTYIELPVVVEGGVQVTQAGASEQHVIGLLPLDAHCQLKIVRG